MVKKVLNQMYLSEMENFFSDLEEKNFRARQLFQHVHKKNGMNLDSLSVFSKPLKEKILAKGRFLGSRIFQKYESRKDNTKKYVIQQEDDTLIETVYMEHPNHNSLCVSSQVGCKIGCQFCASTKLPFQRNLEPAEILNQVYLIETDLKLRIDHIVLMGIGEPLDNYDHVIKFLKLIHDEEGHNISYRNITLSTSGIVPKIIALADQGIPINLSISLHNPFNSERQEIMPVTRRYPVEELMKACQYYFNKTKRRVTFEYTLIQDQNDSYRHASKLIQLLKGMNCHVNLMSLNPIDEYQGIGVETQRLYQFKEWLEKSNIVTSIRKKHGDDINGACGQLRQHLATEYQ